MVCKHCGEQCHGRLCSLCEQIQHNEKMYGTTNDDRGSWGDSEGQTEITAGDEE